MPPSEIWQEVMVGITMLIPFVHGMRPADRVETMRPVHDLLLGGDVGFVIGEAEIELIRHVGFGDVLFSQAGMALLLQAVFVFLGGASLSSSSSPTK